MAQIEYYLAGQMQLYHLDFFPPFHFAKCAPGCNLKLHRPDLCLCLLSCHKCLTEVSFFSRDMTEGWGAHVCVHACVHVCVRACVRVQDPVLSVPVHQKDTVVSKPPVTALEIIKKKQTTLCLGSSGWCEFAQRRSPHTTVFILSF